MNEKTNMTALPVGADAKAMAARIDLSPKTFEEAIRFAELMAQSSIVPKDYQGMPGNILVAVQWGMEIGLKPMQAMQNIAVINGRPSIWGDAMIALVQGSGVLEDMTEELDPSGKYATCTVTRGGKQVSRTFTLEDAKVAGLTGKQGPWKQYPRRMLQMRARAWVLRDVFADVLKGVYIAEEARDMPTEGVTVDVAPKASSDRAERARAALTNEKNKAPDSVLPPSLEQVIEAISSADTESALGAAADLATGLIDRDDKTKARKAWKARKAQVDASDEPPMPKQVDGMPTIVDTTYMDVAESMDELDKAWEVGEGIGEGEERATWDAAYHLNKKRLAT